MSLSDSMRIHQSEALRWQPCLRLAVGEDSPAGSQGA